MCIRADHSAHRIVPYATAVAGAIIGVNSAEAKALIIRHRYSSSCAG